MLIAQGLSKKYKDFIALDESTLDIDPLASNDMIRNKETDTHISAIKTGILIHSLKSDKITLNELEKLYLEIMKTKYHAANS